MKSLDYCEIIFKINAKWISLVLNVLTEKLINKKHCLTRDRVLLTNNVEMVRVIDGSILVFHYARIISFVRWDHALHDETPVLVADLEGCNQRGWELH